MRPRTRWRACDGYRWSPTIARFAEKRLELVVDLAFVAKVEPVDPVVGRIELDPEAIGLETALEPEIRAWCEGGSLVDLRARRR